MRLLIYVHSLAAGGAERVAVNLANYWADKGWEITIVTVASNDADFYKVNRPVKRVALELTGESRSLLIAARRNIRRVMALKRMLWETQPDVALAVMSNANVILALASFGLPHICTIGSEHIFPPRSPLGSIWGALRRRTYGQLDAVVALTEECAGWIRKNTTARRVPVIPNAVCWPLPENVPKVSPASVCPRERHLLLAVGRLTAQKDFGLLIEVFAQLAPSHTDWNLVVLGNGPDREALESKVRAAKLEDRIGIHRAVGNMADWYEYADLYVMSSDFEGFPNTLIEALAHGVAAVSFDCDTGPRDIVRQGIDGLLVPAGDVAGFTQALDRLMRDSDLRSDFAARAVEARERFSIEKISTMWEELFHQCARDKGCGKDLRVFRERRGYKALP
jgi:glycosyltransferase involved in cell wall biosynthesis